jgi:hypothetical protein
VGIEAFPEIESFQKLPHQVIVRGGSWSLSEHDGAELRGIVINNIGHAICDIKLNLVIFDENKIPTLNTSTSANPEALPQGGIATFVFRLKDFTGKIAGHHLYTNWRFND